MMQIDTLSAQPTALALMQSDQQATSKSCERPRAPNGSSGVPIKAAYQRTSPHQPFICAHMRASPCDTVQQLHRAG